MRFVVTLIKRVEGSVSLVTVDKSNLIKQPPSAILQTSELYKKLKLNNYIYG